MQRRITITPLWIAALLALSLAVWLITGTQQQARQQAPDDHVLSEAQNPNAPDTPKVKVRRIQAQQHPMNLILQGQLKAWQSVELKARLDAPVSARPVKEGSRVEAGQILLQLAPEDRPAQLAQAQADLALAQEQLTASERLQQKNLSARTEVLSRRRDLANAQATLANRQQQMADLTPRAPFSGILNQISVDLGDLLSPGETWGELVDLDQLKATAQVPQQQIEQVSLNDAVTVTLLNGDTLPGHVHFISAQADPETRSFRVEATVPNPEQRPLAGVSATLTLATGQVTAHKLSPAFLTLDDQGRLGVQYVTEQHTAGFLPVQIIDTQTDGVWVAGLPEQLDLITLGGGFVHEGQKVSTEADGWSP
ncbi:hypothetical protein BFW38_17475 [Terasakiispira papahanaumokuakeensis]|uniref:Uncharacterized protein n=1 Tax=Terasakiispira papahanaumokuakeensis TaxID=197479 RepID=A0A1E2VEF9_9GAMM|nr:efflux RND transporter periplasmic adaptor subunit [Terasakiispira papahanaumokuakeensis]ODC05055.1 hypothetical protein BFW38_17475 [Terasakiispira papahanaumokuakeensis]